MEYLGTATHPFAELWLLERLEEPRARFLPEPEPRQRIPLRRRGVAFSPQCVIPPYLIEFNRAWG